MEFRCRLASPSGEIVEGLYEAESEARLRHELEERGLFILSLRPRNAVAGVSLELPRRKTIKTREFLVFNQELATLLKAGMPLVQSLDLLRRRVDSPLFRRVLDDVYEKVRAGTAMSEAFSAHQGFVPRVYTASLFAGERSGNLDGVLRRYVEYTKIVATVKRKTLSALVYPIILTSLSILLVLLIVLVVVPSFSEFYDSFGHELPFATRMIVGLSAFVRHNLIPILIVLAAAVVGGRLLTQQANYRARLHRLILRIPMLGDVARKFATSQMSRTLATLLGGGLPLVNALDIAANAVGNQHMASELEVVAGRVREGESFASALDARGVFPEVAVKMAEVGESTGALQEMLNTVADFYDEEIATTMDRFTTLLEPTLLVMMGIVIAGLLLALYMPLFQLTSVLQ